MPATSHLLQENGRPAIPPALTLNDRLALIALIDEGARGSVEESPVVADLFNDLWNLVGATVSGSRISRLKPEGARNGFQVFEITSESGEALGRLHMLYLKKPIPCYYLVYVEVAPPFRKKGLGNRILAYYREFLDSRSAVGILDNIIPANDPTFDIYTKQAWEPIEAIVGDGVSDPWDHYMIYVPPALRGRDLRKPALRLIYHLKRKRAAIDMRENELMVKRTIAEFRALYDALLLYFEPELGNPPALAPVALHVHPLRDQTDCLPPADRRPHRLHRRRFPGAAAAGPRDRRAPGSILRPQGAGQQTGFRLRRHASVVPAARGIQDSAGPVHRGPAQLRAAEFYGLASGLQPG